MMKITLTFLSLLFINLTFGQTQSLFKIVQNDSIGYINDKGSIVIKPVFLSGNDFSEGLAAVRQNGLYGFIDGTGTFVIKPEYDYATYFLNGLTVVYKKGNPYFLDKTGKTALPTVYKTLTFLDQGKGIITTHTNKQGVIDLISKKLLIDTVFSSINEFKYGVAIVEEYISPGRKKKQKRIGVIDTTGRFVVPFGKYETIKPFYDGYAIVEIEDKKSKDGNIDGVINVKGNLLFERPYKNNSYVEGNFHDGYAKVSLYKYWIPEKKGVISTSEKNYEGFINLKGEVVFNDTNYIYVNDFSNGRAFVKTENDDYILIDKNFKRIGNNTFEDILNDSYNNDYAIVETNDGFGIIDTSGNFIVQPQYEEINRIGLINDYFFFATDNDDDKKLYGISDITGKILVKPIIQEFDPNGFVNGLIKTIVDEKLTYINKNGDIVWKQQKDTLAALKTLNIDFINRGYFYAYSTPKNSEGDYSGGWATSLNKPRKNSELKFPTDVLAITIDTNLIDTFATQYIGYKLFVSNSTGDTIKFNAQDSRLYMKLQAQNDKGEWKDIEYLPSSWCGNSYHKIELEPNAYWSFIIPNYHGEFQTLIRAELKYIDKTNPKIEKVVYSNIINGSINPGQFWNRQTYHPSGIMDPYNN